MRLPQLILVTNPAQRKSWDKLTFRVDIVWRREGLDRAECLLGGRRRTFSYNKQCLISEIRSGRGRYRTNEGAGWLQFILAHAESPLRRDADGIREWRQGMSLLAKNTNLGVKISELGMYALK